jgi:hypothetical protein
MKLFCKDSPLSDKSVCESPLSSHFSRNNAVAKLRSRIQSDPVEKGFASVKRIAPANPHVSGWLILKYLNNIRRNVREPGGAHPYRPV